MSSKFFQNLPLSNSYHTRHSVFDDICLATQKGTHNQTHTRHSGFDDICLATQH